jgi:hypothetical protein
MKDELEWKAEISFKGTAAEFNRFAESVAPVLKAEGITLALPELRRPWPEPEPWPWPWPGPWPGLWPIPIDVLLGAERIKPMVQDMPELQINFIRDIRGGIRTPHLHLGDKVVLLDRASFKTVVAQVASELAARRVEAMEDYVDVVSAVAPIAAIPIQLP